MKRTESIYRLRVLSIQTGRFLYPEEVTGRPRTRGECEAAVRPCPWVGCKHHLYLDVMKNGSIVYRFPHLEPWQLQHSCALDVADEGHHTLAQVAAYAGVEPQRIGQVEHEAIAKLSGSRLEHWTQ